MYERRISKMKEQIEARLNDLKSEFESGQKVLTELETRHANLNNTLLRISGAIQVLEEELIEFNGDPVTTTPQDDSTSTELYEVKKEAVKN